MSNVSMQFNIDLNDVKQLNAFSRLFSELSGLTVEAQPEKTSEEVKKEPEVEVDQKPKRAPRATKEKPAKVTPKKDKEEAQGAESDQEDIKVEDVRALLAGLVNEHRDSIKSKLTELGAKNLTTLSSDNYQEFVDFLNSL